jgi:peptide/nickel transport system substrate-binding protein
MQSISEWSTRKLMFLAGDADFCYVPRAYLAEMIPFPEGIRCDYPLVAVQTNPALFFTYDLVNTSQYLGPGFDPATPLAFGDDRIPTNFFADPDVRKAFIQSFDFGTYLSDVFMGEAKRQHTWQPEPLEYYNPDQTGYEYDLAEATAAFQRAWGGAVWENGFACSLLYNEGNDQRGIACEMIKAAIETLNPKFSITVQPVPWPTYLKGMVAQELGAWIIGWGADFPDAHNFAVPFMEPNFGTFSSWQKVQYGTVGHMQIAPYGDPALEIDNDYVATLISEGAKSTDPAERETIYYELQEIYVAEAIGTPLAYATGRHWERTWVGGYFYNAIRSGPAWYYYIWKEELPAEDLDMNGEVDIFDIVRLAGAFGSDYVAGSPHPDWDSRADINEDTVVDIFDVVLIAKQFGTVAPPWTPPP